jgi:protein TonB
VDVKSSASSVVEHASLWGAATAIAVHVLLAAVFVSLPARRAPGSMALPVEVELTSMPTEPLPPPPPPPDPPPDPPPKLVVRKLGTHIKPPPPMPNREVKPTLPTEEPPKPVFGVTQDSVVTGESPIALPVGNTLMTNDRTPAKSPPAPLLAAPPPAEGSFNPVDDESIDDLAVPSVKVNPDYPEMARRMGIGGRVHLKIGVDRHGNVRSARVIGKVGYGMDEAALKAIWLHKFHPSKNSKGEAVDSILTYDIVFQPPAGR